MFVELSAGVAKERVVSELDAALEEVCLNCERGECSESFYTGCAIHELLDRFKGFLSDGR